MIATAKLIGRFDEEAVILLYATSGLSRDQETATPGPGAWTISELVAHLLDTDLVMADRMKRILAENDPTLIPFAENAWIERLHSKAMPVEEAVNLFVAHRHWMSRILKKCTDADFARTGQHLELGRVTLAEVLIKAVNHVDHHLPFLYAKRANLGVSVLPRYSTD